MVGPFGRAYLAAVRYFFDTRDDGDFLADDAGVELVDMDEVKAVATKILAELAVEMIPGSSERFIGVDVRDETKRAVLTTELTFKTTLGQAAA